MNCLRTFRCPTLVADAALQRLELCPHLSQHVRRCARLDAVYLVGIPLHVVKFVFATRVIDVLVARRNERPSTKFGTEASAMSAKVGARSWLRTSCWRVASAGMPGPRTIIGTAISSS